MQDEVDKSFITTGKSPSWHMGALQLACFGGSNFSLVSHLVTWSADNMEYVTFIFEIVYCYFP